MVTTSMLLRDRAKDPATSNAQLRQALMTAATELETTHQWALLAWGAVQRCRRTERWILVLWVFTTALWVWLFVFEFLL